MLRMSCIGEIYRVIFAFVGLEVFIFFEKRLLLDGVLFAGNMRRLFVGKPKAPLKAELRLSSGITKTTRKYSTVISYSKKLHCKAEEARNCWPM